jgi:hypothetical protein
LATGQQAETAFSLAAARRSPVERRRRRRPASEAKDFQKKENRDSLASGFKTS